MDIHAHIMLQANIGISMRIKCAKIHAAMVARKNLYAVGHVMQVGFKIVQLFPLNPLQYH